MSNLKDQLINAFPGKMEKKDTFLMQFVMELIQKGQEPPKKEELEKNLNELVKDGIFREKEGLLIYNRKNKGMQSGEQETIQESQSLTSGLDLSQIQSEILSVFQGKFENKTAIMMNVSVQAATKGSPPPSKDEMNEAIDDLLKKEVLEEKGDILIRKN
ncbi:MAG: hypothetical protein ACXAB2_16595 [Candidatus Hodarchaeales archaeon]|jgi:hypothetical protein